MSTASWGVAAVTPAQPFEVDPQIPKVSLPPVSGNLVHLSSFLSRVAHAKHMKWIQADLVGSETEEGSILGMVG